MVEPVSLFEKRKGQIRNSVDAIFKESSSVIEKLGSELSKIDIRKQSRHEIKELSAIIDARSIVNEVATQEIPRNQCIKDLVESLAVILDSVKTVSDIYHVSSDFRNKYDSFLYEGERPFTEVVQAGIILLFTYHKDRVGMLRSLILHPKSEDAIEAIVFFDRNMVINVFIYFDALCESLLRLRLFLSPSEPKSLTQS
jgi:hypothetical protein